MKRTTLVAAVLALMFVSWLTLPAGQGPAKTPVPDQKAQAKAMKLVHDVFGDDLEAATTTEKKLKLATKLFQEGKEVKDDPVLRYVCFREARDLAAKANDTSLALAIVDELQQGYDVDALLLKADVLGLAVAGADKEGGLALVELIRPLLAEAVDLDHYKAAYQLGDAAIAAAKKAQSVSLVLELQKRIGEIQAIEKKFNELAVYQERLKKNPDDGEANLELGKYFGFQKKRWERALKHFAASSDEALKELARQDLKDPKDIKDQEALADGWWELAGKHKDGAKLAIQMRAMFWYDKAIPGLSGLNRTKAQKRIDIVQEQLAGTPVVVAPIAGPVGEFKRFDGHTEEIKAVAFAHDGRFVASGSKDLTVRIWDLNAAKDAKETQTLRGHAKEIWGLAFHPNNRQIFSASWDATARLWDVKTGNEVKRFTHTKDVNALALSRDGNTLLTGCDDERVYLWNVTSGDEIRKYTGHTDYVYAVAFSPDGRYIASGSKDRTVRVFDRTSGQQVKSFDGHTDSVTAVAFTSDSKFVLSAGDSVIHVWDISTGKEAPRRFEPQSGRIASMAISPDGRRLVTGGDDRTVKYWEVATGKVIQSFAGHTDTVTCIAFSHDGRRAVSGGYDKTVRVWNLPAR